MDKTGGIYPLLKMNEALASAKRAGPEFTGACFSPDGKYFFVNCQSPLNITIAVTGPWLLHKSSRELIFRPIALPNAAEARKSRACESFCPSLVL